MLCAEMPLSFPWLWDAHGIAPGCHQLSETGQTPEVCNQPGSQGAAFDSSLLTHRS